MPPTHSPFRLEAAILSRMRSEVISRSNWAKDRSTLSVNRPIEVVVLNCWVTDTNETSFTPESGHVRCNWGCPLRAKSRHEGPTNSCLLYPRKRTFRRLSTIPRSLQISHGASEQLRKSVTKNKSDD